MTFVANTGLTAAQLNTFVRDNFNELETAKATTAASSWFNSTGRNAIAERLIASAAVGSFESTTLTAYADIPGGSVGPSVTLATGKQVIYATYALMQPGTTDINAYVNVAVTGDTVLGPSDATEMIGFSGSAVHNLETCFVGWLSGLNEGINTFTLKYKTSSGTSSFGNRRVLIMAVW